MAEGITEVQSNILIKSISRYSQKNRSKDYKLNSTTSHTIANKHFFVLQGTIYYDNLIWQFNMTIYYDNLLSQSYDYSGAWDF